MGMLDRAAASLVGDTGLLRPGTARSVLLADGDGGDGGYGGNGGGVDLTRFLTPTVVLILLAAAAVLLLVLAIGGAVIYRRLKKRGVIDRGLMTLRAETLPDGPLKELNQLRLKLQQAVTNTRRSVELAASGGRDVSELLAVTSRLEQVAGGVDRDLTMLMLETDTAMQTTLLAPARDRVGAVAAAGTRVRTALLQSSAAIQDADAADVTAALDEEVSRLSSFTQAYRELRGGT